MAIGGQLGAINPKYRRNQRAELEGRMTGLAGIVRNQQQAEMIQREDAYRQKVFAEDKRQHQETMKLDREQAKQAFNLEVGKTAVNLGTSDFLGKGGFGGTTLSGAYGGIKNFFGGGTQAEKMPYIPASAAPQTMGQKIGGYFQNIPIGSLATGGLAGYGLGGMFGGNSESKKMLYGGLAGAGLGLLSGGLSGALGGGIGGLFGGAIA